MAQLISGTTIDGHSAIHAGNLASHSIATTSYVTTQINNLINGAPGALDTLNELAAALGNNASFSTSVTNSLAGKLSLTGGTMTGAIVVNLGNVSSDTVAFKVGGPSNYDSLTIGMEDTPDYDAYIASFGNDIRFYSGKDVGTEDHRFYWFTSKAGTSQHSQIAMQLDHNQNLSVTGGVYASGGNSGNWNTAYGWGNHASAGYLTSLPAHNHDGRYLLLSGGTLTGDLLSTHPLYPGYNNGAVGSQGSYYLYGDTGNSGIRTNGNFLANGDIYLGTRGQWLSTYLNQAVRTDSAPSFSSVTLGGSQLTGTQVNGLSNMLGVTTLPYSVDITVGGDPDRFYAVQFWGGDQDVWRRIIIKRGYSEPAPWDPIGTGVHHGGLLLDWEGNFGGWGGAEYADRLRVFNESYTNVCADMFIYSHSMGYVFMLRGGEAVYHLFSDQPINGFYQSGSPDILYDSSTLSYDHSNPGYDVYAPAPLSLGQVNSTRIDGLRTKKQSLLDGRYLIQGSDISGISTISATNFRASNAFYLNGTSYYLNSSNGGIYTNARFESASTIYASGGNSGNWNTAYGWGNHASAGYLTSLPSHNHDDRYYTETEINNFSYWRNDEERRVKILLFTGEGGNSANTTQSYAIYQAGGAWTHPYPDLRIAFHTGIQIGANSSYGGTRFYNEYDMVTELMSVGNGDNHVRVANNLYVTGTITLSEIQLNAGPYLQTYNDRNLIIKGNSSSDAGIEGRNAAGNNVFQIYGSGSDYGFLNGTWAAWDLKKTKNGALYMNDNNSYYLQTNSTSNFYALNIQGSAVVHAGNIASQSVTYSTTAGALTSMNISQFTNNSGYITSVGNITRLWAESHPNDYYVRANWTGSYWQLTSNHPSPVQVGYADNAGAVAWTNVSSRPTALSQFSNDLGNYGGFLTSLPSHTHDDRYYTETESDSRFVNESGDSMSGSLTLGAGAAYVGTHGTWTGEQNKIQWHSTHLYLQNTGGGNFFFRRADGTNIFNLDNNGSLIISGDLYPNGQGTYRLYVANSGLWTNGNFGASGDLYLGTRSTWLSSWLNQSVQTGANPTFGEIYVNGKYSYFGASSGWDSGSLNGQNGTITNVHFQGHQDFWIGAGNTQWYTSAVGAHHDLLINTMQSGGSNVRGITFTASNGGASVYRLGRWHSGTSAITSYLNLENRLAVGVASYAYELPSATVYVKGSTDGADVLAVDGVNGRLFTITDSVLDTIYSVNTIAGLPILEVLANSTVKLGPFSAPIVINASGISTPSHGTSANWFTAFNKRPTGIGFSGSSTKTLTLTLGDGSTLTAAFNDIDTDTNTDAQTLSISGSTLTISGGNSITIPSGGISQATADGLYQPLENQRLSTGNAPTFNDIYNNSWFRNNAVNTGLYNQSSGNHFYSRTAAKWGITGNGGNIHLEFRSNHESTLRGVVYADTSNQIGFLNNGEGWAIRANSSNNVFVHGTDLTINADNAGASNINMNDGDEGARIIHCNSNRIGFLTQAGSWGAYCDDAGNWTAANFSGSSSGTNTGDQTNISGNSATTSQRNFDYLYASSYLESGGAVYGTIFYDNNDRDYYADFNTTSNSAIRVRGGMLMGPNPSWGAYLQVGGNGNESAYASVVTTNGNLHLDAADGRGTYINHYSGGTIYFGTAGTWTITGDGSYYNGTSAVANSVAWGNVSSRPTALSQFSNDLGNYGGWITSSGSISGNAATATRTSGNNGYGHPGTGMWAFFNWGGSNGGASAPTDNSYTTGISVGSHPSDQAYGFQIANNMWNTGLWTRNYNSGFGDWIRLLDGSNHPYAAGMNQYVNTGSDPTFNSIYLANGNLRLYQGDGTALRVVTAYGWMNLGAQNGSWTHMYASQAFYFNQNLYVNGTQVVTNSGTWSINVSGSAGSVAWTNVSSRPTALSQFSNDLGNYGGWITSSGSISGNAATATNVAASGITGQTGMWTSAARPGPYRLYRNEDDSAYNVQTTWSANISGYWSLRGYIGDTYHAPCYVGYSGYADSAGSASSAARATRANGNFYIDDNYGNTVVGVYSASRLQGVFAMGDSYKLAADGSSAADHYGIAWSHPNAGGTAARLTNHGMLVQGAGQTWTAISDSIWCIGDITAFSDARVKANVEVIDNPLERLSKVRGVTFTRIDLADPTKRYAGVIAQEMREALPEVVTEDGNGELSVSYGNTVSLLIESIKAQQVQIEELKLEVKKLKGK